MSLRMSFCAGGLKKLPNFSLEFRANLEAVVYLFELGIPSFELSE